MEILLDIYLINILIYYLYLSFFAQNYDFQIKKMIKNDFLFSFSLEQDFRNDVRQEAVYVIVKP